MDKRLNTTVFFINHGFRVINVFAVILVCRFQTDELTLLISPYFTTKKQILNQIPNHPIKNRTLTK